MDKPSDSLPTRGSKRRFKFQVSAPSGIVMSTSAAEKIGLFPALNCGGGGAGPGTSFTDKSGGKLTNVHVQLIFWGSGWAGGVTPSVNDVTTAVQNLLAGPYMTFLAQYGVRRGTLRGTTVITNSDPPKPFAHINVGNFLTQLIDADTLPEPDEDWQILHCVIMLPSATFFDSAVVDSTGLNVSSRVAGENARVIWHDYDLFDVDNDPIHFTWIGNDGTLDYVTTVLSHELVEACTDPGGGSGIVAVAGTPGCPSTGGCQIGDVCTGMCGTVNGVRVQGYWAQRTPQDFTGQNGTCIVPTTFSLRMILVDKDLSKGVRSLMPPHVSSVRTLIDSVR